MSDWQYIEETCPKCGEQLVSAECSDCGGEGGHDGYEEDPLWYDYGDMIPCDLCSGRGYHCWCRECGWDVIEKRFSGNEGCCVELFVCMNGKLHVGQFSLRNDFGRSKFIEAWDLANCYCQPMQLRPQP